MDIHLINAVKFAKIEMIFLKDENADKYSEQEIEELFESLLPAEKLRRFEEISFPYNCIFRERLKVALGLRRIITDEERSELYVARHKARINAIEKIKKEEAERIENGTQEEYLAQKEMEKRKLTKNSN